MPGRERSDSAPYLICRNKLFLPNHLTSESSTTEAEQIENEDDSMTKILSRWLRMVKIIGTRKLFSAVTSFPDEIWKFVSFWSWYNEIVSSLFVRKKMLLNRNRCYRTTQAGNICFKTRQDSDICALLLSPSSS